MNKLWFSYSMRPGMNLDSPAPANSPYTISWYLGNFLRSKVAEIGYEFEYRNLDDTSPVEFGKLDIVLGHTWWSGGFMHQALDADVRAKFILQPYTAHMVSEGDVERNRAIFAKADHLFLITGQYHWDTMPDSPYADWQERATRVDMAVDPAMHPHSKRTWNKAGKRGFLAIGVDRPYKGLDKVAELARISGIRLGYFGDPKTHVFDDVPNLIKYGGTDFTPQIMRKICDEYDFFITMGRYDANPTTLLEAACWGLIPLCTKESGYWPRQPFDELRLDDMAFNWEQVECWQNANETDLWRISQALRAKVAAHYTWERFCTSIWEGMQAWL